MNRNIEELLSGAYDTKLEYREYTNNEHRIQSKNIETLG